MDTSPATRLTIVPALQAASHGDERVEITRKFVDGVKEYARYWDGPIRVLMREGPSADSTSLDDERWAIADLPFEFQWLEHEHQEQRRQLVGSRIVLGSLMHRNLELPDLCADENLPLVWITECSAHTRKQIIHAETRNPLLRLRRQIRANRLESHYKRCIASSAGVQCNGTPTFEAYKDISPNPLLFFDTRVSNDELVAEEILRARTSELLKNKPLRLAFSGRFMKIKGAHHLAEVASHLQRIGIAFTMDICGDGVLTSSIQKQIDCLGLAEKVRMKGNLNFHDELLPFISSEVDLFVCCHLQGDPSCTYLETMACGTPIVGYDNEAFSGIVGRSGVGWTTPLGNPGKIALAISGLNADRQGLADAANRSRNFASHNLFEQTMRRRMEHLEQCSA